MKPKNYFSKIKNTLAMLVVFGCTAFFSQDAKAQNFSVFVSMEITLDDSMAPGKYQWVARLFAYKSSGGNATRYFQKFDMYFSYDTTKLKNPRYYVIIKEGPILDSAATYSLTQGRYTINPGTKILSQANMPSSHVGRNVLITSTSTTTADTNGLSGTAFSSALPYGELFRIYFDIDSSSSNVPPTYYPNSIDANPVYWNPSATDFLADIVNSSNVSIAAPGVNPANPANPIWFGWPYNSLGTTNWSVNHGNVNSFSFGGYSTPTLTPLPVEYLSFDAKQTGEHVYIKWITASEINNSHFEIERSQDGEQWLTLGQVAGAGNGDEMNVYEYMDMNPVSGANYYRLKQIDFNGEVAYSDLRVVILGQGLPEKVAIYPNPARDVVSVDVPAEVEVVNTEIRSIDGRVLGNNSFQNTGRADISINHLAPGMYYIHIQMGDQLIVRPFVKQ